jgi:SnoaL-like domain
VRAQQPDAGDVAAASDAFVVAQLVLRERQTRDRGWWDEMAACFTPDATIDMSWISGSADDFIRQTQDRSSGGVWGRHGLSPPVVCVLGDRAWAELPLGIEFPVVVSGTDADLVSYCRSQYRARRVGDVWRLARITSIYERDLLVPSVSGTELVIDPVELSGYRPSYRCLAWYFAQRGTPLRDDLLGDDRPEPVALHYASERSWLLGAG